MTQLAEREVGIKPEIPLGERDFLGILQQNIETILQEQHPQTGLFPAATEDHREIEDHYGDAWVRDHSATIIGLLDPFVLRVFPEDSEIGFAIRNAGVKAINGILGVIDNPPWQEGFDQELKIETDNMGRRYTTLTKHAPPIHFKTDGSLCDWPSQNQADSWGEFLIAVSLGLKQGLISLTPSQQKAVDRVASYLIRIDVPNHKQSSMWEPEEVLHHPAPLSTIAITGKGLEEIMPFISPGLKKLAARTAQRHREEVLNNYPIDYTTLNHSSQTDLATLYAHGLHALDYVPLSQYLNPAYKELGNGKHPGKKRFSGDSYYMEDGEAFWVMALLIESLVFLDKAEYLFSNGNKYAGNGYKNKGMQVLERAIDVHDQIGYLPELFIQRNGDFVPNNNDILWARSLMVQTLARAKVLNS